MPEEYWAHFIHEANIGVRGVGKSKEQAFEQAGLALTAVVTEPEKVASDEGVAINCTAPDDAHLFADFLNALVHEMATRKMIFGRYEVHLNGNQLNARAWGEKVVTKHDPAVELKGATYTDLMVKQDSNGMWLAQCIVDV
jgi:tRNA nucleotidyltransferase (CCA-adding enzyme)